MPGREKAILGATVDEFGCGQYNREGAQITGWSDKEPDRRVFMHVTDPVMARRVATMLTAYADHVDP